MTIKEYLLQYQAVEAERINLLAERSLTLVEEALPSGIDYSADRVQTSPSDQMLNRIIRIQRRTKYIDKRIEKIENWQNMVKDQINSLDYGVYKRLLFMKYVESKEWNDIAKELGYWTDASESIYVRGELHSKALIEFQNYLRKLNYKCGKV